MDRRDMVDMLLPVPHGPGYGDMYSADCWGIVELWYRNVLGVRLDDRAGHVHGPDGLAAGFAAAKHWLPVAEPEDDCLVIMRHGELIAGHVGVFFDGGVLHSAPDQGCVFEPVGHRRLRGRITCFLRYTP